MTMDERDRGTERDLEQEPDAQTDAATGVVPVVGPDDHPDTVGDVAGRGHVSRTGGDVGTTGPGMGAPLDQTGARAGFMTTHEPDPLDPGGRGPGTWPRSALEDTEAAEEERR